MKTYTVSYTTDYSETVNTIKVTALDYTKAYLAAIVALPFDVAILEAKEDASLPA